MKNWQRKSAVKLILSTQNRIFLLLVNLWPWNYVHSFSLFRRTLAVLYEITFLAQKRASFTRKQQTLKTAHRDKQEAKKWDRDDNNNNSSKQQQRISFLVFSLQRRWCAQNGNPLRTLFSVSLLDLILAFKCLQTSVLTSNQNNDYNTAWNIYYIMYSMKCLKLNARDEQNVDEPIDIVSQNEEKSYFLYTLDRFVHHANAI